MAASAGVGASGPGDPGTHEDEYAPPSIMGKPPAVPARRRALPVLVGACLLAACGERSGGPPGDPYEAPITELTELRTVASAPPIYGACELTLAQRMGGTDEFGEVWDIFPLDDTHILAVDHYAEPLFRVIDERDGRLVQAFGQMGEGPREFESPSSVYWSRARPGTLEIYDRVNQRVTWYDYSEPGRLAFADETPLRVQEHVSHIRPLEAGYMGNGTFPFHTLSVFRPAGDVFERLVTDPAYGPDDTPGYSFFGLFNKTIMDARNDRVALVYWRKSYIDLIDLESRTYRRLRGPHPVEASFEIVDGRLYPTPGTSFSQGAYNSVIVTDRLVYALFDGDERNGLFFVQVYRWEDGRFLAEYELDRGIHIIRLSPDGRTLYGDFEDPYPRIGKWNLPPLGDALDRVERGEDPAAITLCP